MTDLAVRVDNLGKRYQIRTGPQPGQAMLREVLSGFFVTPFTKLAAMTPRAWRRPVADARAAPPPGPDHIWALRNVSFDVPRGEILGIIGPNGAGKSTLLKILSRITEPTKGRAEIHGRVASLLEVGVGFHPELTGRENIYLSGALLGMRKAEIDRKLDEIIAFAEVETFVETPVKHYSSGMYVRLAFAVAAHLEPEILIIDEVLAVGDVGFQRKCLSKMEDVRQHGRTILFVSHNMPAMTRICQRAILISKGGLALDGPASHVVSKYVLSQLHAGTIKTWSDPQSAPHSDVVRLRAVRVCNEDGTTLETADIRRPVGIELTYEVLAPGHALVPFCHFFNETGLCIFVTQDLEPAWRGRPKPVGTFTSTAWIPGNFLAEGVLFASVGIFSTPSLHVHFYERDTLVVHIVDSPQPDTARGDWEGHLWGVVRPLLKWTTISPSRDVPPHDPPLPHSDSASSTVRGELP